VDIKCEGYEIAYSAHDEQCDGCKVAVKCSESTKYKLNNRGGTTMAKPKKLTEKQLKALLAKTKTAAAIKSIVSDNGYDVKLVKGMSVQDAKDAIVLAAFPPAEDPDDDFDDADDFGDDATDEKDVKEDDDGDDDFSDSDSDVDAGSDVEPGDDADSDAEADLDDPEDIDSLEARVTALEKRLDDVLATLQKAPASAGKPKSGKAEKDAIKAKLLEACPYKKADLEKLNGREIKMLASAVGVNSFRQARPDTEKEILKAKLNKKPAAK